MRSLQARNSRSFNRPLSPGHHLPPAAVALAPGHRRGAAPQVLARPRAEARCPKRPKMLPRRVRRRCGTAAGRGVVCSDPPHRPEPRDAGQAPGPPRTWEGNSNKPTPTWGGGGGGAADNNKKMATTPRCPRRSAARGAAAATHRVPGLRVHLAQVADHPHRFGGRWRPERRGSGLQARRRRRRAGTPRPRRPGAGGAPPAAARRDGGGVRDARGPLPHPPGAVSGRRRPVLPSAAAAPRAPAGCEPRAAEGEVEEGGESPSAGAGARSTGDSLRRQFSSPPENFYCCCRRLSQRLEERGAEPRWGR